MIGKWCDKKGILVALDLWWTKFLKNWNIQVSSDQNPDCSAKLELRISIRNLKKSTTKFMTNLFPKKHPVGGRWPAKNSLQDFGTELQDVGWPWRGFWCLMSSPSKKTWASTPKKIFDGSVKKWVLGKRVCSCIFSQICPGVLFG